MSTKEKYDAIRNQLQPQPKEWLFERLCEFLMCDEPNADRIQLYLSIQKCDEMEVANDFKLAINKAIKQAQDHGPADWKSKLPHKGFEDIADALAELSLNGNDYTILEIAEYALLGLDSISVLQDECELDYVIDAFRKLHVNTCYKLKPDPKHFGLHLAKLANKSEWGFFDGPPKGYVEILGQEGLSSYNAALK